MLAYDISTPTPMESLKEKSGVLFKHLELSLDLVYACHIEFGSLQDVCLSKMYDARSISEDDYYDDDDGGVLMRHFRYSIQKPVKKDEAVSRGHFEFLTWYNSLPSSIRDVKKGLSFHPSFLSFQYD
jgi:hypothetical protein